MFRALRLAVAVAVLVMAANPSSAQPVHAFTLVSCITDTVTVSPTSGYPTSALKADGVCSPGPCGQAITFNFYWDAALNFIWSSTVTACNAAKSYDTGFSPAFAPPAGYDTVGGHTVIVNLTNSNGTPIGSASTTYTIKSPPPPPPPPSPSKPPPPPPPSPVRQTPPSTQPTTSPSTVASPTCAPGAVTAGCSSPSANTCPAALLPKAGTGGWGDDTIAALMVGAALPIAGLAMFGPQTLLAAAYRRRRFLTLFGLSALAVLALNCTFPTASNPQNTPAAAVTPSAASTPSSCSA